MKSFLIAALLLTQSGLALAQQRCADDTTARMIQFPLTEADTRPVFYYFNDEWIAEAGAGMVMPDSILKIEIKDDTYGNRAVFITVSPETLAQLKSKVHEETKNLFINYDPICEFPGGNGKLKEWLESNIRVPEGYKGTERVVVTFKVQPDGTVTDPRIVKGSKNEAANNEAMRLVSELPRFRVRYCTPRKAPITMGLPITFREPGLIYIRGNESAQR